MKITRLLTFLSAVLLMTAPAANAQLRKPQIFTSSDKKNKKQLLEENLRITAQLDSLHRLLEESRKALAMSDSIANSMTATVQEDTHWMDTGIAPEDYTPEITDSLLSIWYLQNQIRYGNDAEEYDMEKVEFTTNVPDSVYLRRLSKMNSFITLPYNETVKNYIILYSEKMPTKMSQMMGLAQYYFPIIEEVLSRYNMPDELKYMAVIESAFDPKAVSRAGAKGLWQFMYTTARHYGLKMNSFLDERFDAVKSADAAARYMMDAYKIFGDWNLAICSYNCGAGNVNKAIRRSGSREFWDLYPYLPRETRGYVPAFVGAMYAFTYYKEHGIVPAEVNLPSHVDTLSINKMLHFKQVEELVGIPMQTLRDLNPQYLHDIVPANGDIYTLRIPVNYTMSFVDNEDSVYTHKASEYFSPATIQNIKNAVSNEGIVYRVKNGDYLGKIAMRHHVTVTQLKRWNNLRSDKLRIGQRLIIYPR